MKKSEFVDLVQDKGDYKTKIEAEAAIKAITDSITEALAKGEDVSLVGFGSFAAKLQKGKTGKVPGTDKTYTTQDKMFPKFKASTVLKKIVEEGKQ